MIQHVMNWLDIVDLCTFDWTGDERVQPFPINHTHSCFFFIMNSNNIRINVKQ